MLVKLENICWKLCFRTGIRLLDLGVPLCFEMNHKQTQLYWIKYDISNFIHWFFGKCSPWVKNNHRRLFEASAKSISLITNRWSYFYYKCQNDETNFLCRLSSPFLLSLLQVLIIPPSPLPYPGALFLSCTNLDPFFLHVYLTPQTTFTYWLYFNKCPNFQKHLIFCYFFEDV